MSTPSGKPFDPFDLSPYAPKRARERSILARPSFEDDDREQTADQHDGNHHDVDAHDDVALDAAAPAAPRASVPEEEPGQFALDFSMLPGGEPATGLQAMDAIGAAPAQVPDGGDLGRLQSSVRFLRREAGLAPAKRTDRNESKHGGDTRERLPRVAQLKPISGLGPLDPDGPRPRPEQYINGVRVPPSLAPERLRRPRPMHAAPRPPAWSLARAGRDRDCGIDRLLFLPSLIRPTTAERPANGSTLASFAARLVASAEFPLAKEKLRPDEAKAYEVMVASRNKAGHLGYSLFRHRQPASAPALAPTPVRYQRLSLLLPLLCGRLPLRLSRHREPAAGAGVDHPARQAVRALDPDTVNLLLQQGEQR